MPSSEYMKEYRQKRRLAAIEYLGGVCVVCGTTSALEIDHINPQTKSFTLSGFTGSKKDFWTEVDKCQLLCKTHHLEKTQRDLEVPEHGTTTMFFRGCRCDDCKIKVREKRREYNIAYRGRP